jgi:hypothetical protein
MKKVIKKRKRSSKKKINKASIRLTGHMSTGEKNLRSKYGNLLIFQIYDSSEVKTAFVKNELCGSNQEEYVHKIIETGVGQLTYK